MNMLSVEEKQELEEQDNYGIEEFFLSEVDSWFTADIACCDNCKDDFLEKWPFAFNADGSQFQLDQMNLDLFHDGSRLGNAYTKEEFHKFVRLVSCPRCGDELTYNFYPYCLPFAPVDDFEDIINEIAYLSQKAPFLLLKHYFAVEVSDAIEELEKETLPVSITGYLYRARVASQVHKVNVAEFDITPCEYASEGRYNHTGFPAFYLGSDLETCYQELRGSKCFIAELELKKEIKILDLTATYKNHQKHSDLLDTLVYSALISAKQDESGSFKPQYIFSRFVADCAKYVGFDAIKYPSTRKSDTSFNIVLLNDELSIKGGTSVNRVIQYGGADNTVEVEFFS